EPLLFPVLLIAYRISLNPCAPPLVSRDVPSAFHRPPGARHATAAPTSTSAGGIRITSDAIFISYASIFLPRYSGVRPTISPAMNTATTTKASMPYRPEPTPPKITSPSCINHIGTRPPSGVSESCIALTAPHDAVVVIAANRPEP